MHAFWLWHLTGRSVITGREFSIFTEIHYRAEHNAFTTLEGKTKYAPQIYGRLAELAAAVEKNLTIFTLLLSIH